MSLSKCMTKVKQAGLLEQKWLDQVQEAYDNHTKGGMSGNKAAMQAVDDVIELVLADREALAKKVKEAGGPDLPAPPVTPGKIGINRYLELRKDFQDQAMNIEEVKAAYQEIRDTEELLKAALNKLTKAQLIKSGLAGWRASNSDKKEYLVNSAYMDMLRFWAFDNFSYSPLTEKMEDALDRVVMAQTQNQLDEYYGKKEAAKKPEPEEAAPDVAAIPQREVSMLSAAGFTPDQIEAMSAAERKQTIEDKIEEAKEKVSVKFDITSPSHPPVTAFYISSGGENKMFTLRKYREPKSNTPAQDNYLMNLATDDQTALDKARVYIAAQGGTEVYTSDISLDVIKPTGESEPSQAAEPLYGERGESDPIPAAEATDEQIIAQHGLNVEERIAKSGKTYWAVTGDTLTHKDLLDRLGAAQAIPIKRVWTRSFFDENPTSKIAAALRNPTEEVAPEEDVDPELLQREALPDKEAEKVFKQFKVDWIGEDGQFYLVGKTFPIKGLIKELGGRWDRGVNGWSFKYDAKGQVAKALEDERQKNGTGADDAQDTGPSIDPDEERRLEQLRREQDNRPDERASGSAARNNVSEETQKLIKRGADFGIPNDIMNEQIEDVGLAVTAWGGDTPMFLLANDAGTGKTFVLGGIIREIRKRGHSKFVYVTQSQDLIKQIQRDLAAYDILDVTEFVTYSKLRDADTDGAVLLFDEAHNIKNEASQRGMYGTEKIGAADFTIMASATPFQNPVEAGYLKATGIFESAGGFDDWAKAYGAAVRRRKYFDYAMGEEVVEETIYWPGRGKNQDLAAARNWFFKQGAMTQRRMKIDPDLVDTVFDKRKVSQEYVDIFNNIMSAYDQAEGEYKDQDGNSRDPLMTAQIAMHRENAMKRVLEASKVEFAIERAKEITDGGENVVIFTETKADRWFGKWRKTKRAGEKQDPTLYEYPEMAVMMAEWKQEAAMARMAREKAPPPPFAEFIFEIAAAFHDKGIMYELPSVPDRIVEAFGDNVGMYTGAVTAAKAAKNKEEFLAGKKNVLIATMAKGGTGLSLHDVVGNRPTVQVNINLPWAGWQVSQVSARVARYGLKSKARIEWLYAENIPWEGSNLAPRVGARMADMGALVQGIEHKGAKQLLENFEFEGIVDVSQAEGEGVIEVDQQAEEDIYRQAFAMEESRRKASNTTGGFFETPFPVSAFMTRISGAHNNATVLEPSAGTGNLLRWLPADAQITAVEARSDNFKGLQANLGKWRTTGPEPALVQGDFMEFQGGKFDVVLMNPPFERVKGVGSQDVAHVQRAYDMLAPDGRLVAIMGEGPFFRENNKQDVEFRQWLDDVGATVIKLPQDTFKKSGTGVNVRMVIIDKNDTGGRGDIDLHDISPESLREMETMVPVKPDQPELGAMSTLTRRFDPSENAYVTETDPETSKDKGFFFSGAKRIVESIEMPKAPGDQWLAMLRNKGLKARESDWLELPEILAGKKSVKKETLLRYINMHTPKLSEEVEGDFTGNKGWGTDFIHDVENTRKEENGKTEEYSSHIVMLSDEQAERLGNNGIFEFRLYVDYDTGPDGQYNTGTQTLYAMGAMNNPVNPPQAYDFMPQAETRQEAKEIRTQEFGFWDEPRIEDNILHYLNSVGAYPDEEYFKQDDGENELMQSMRYEDWTLPGGTNYRIIKIQWDNPPAGITYESPHFMNTNNVAHLRTKDRVGPNGEKILWIEEAQADWAREIRDADYVVRGRAERKDIARLQKEHMKIVRQMEDIRGPIEEQARERIEAAIVVEVGNIDRSETDVDSRDLSNDALLAALSKMGKTPLRQYTAKVDYNKLVAADKTWMDVVKADSQAVRAPLDDLAKATMVSQYFPIADANGKDRYEMNINVAKSTIWTHRSEVHEAMVNRYIQAKTINNAEFVSLENEADRIEREIDKYEDAPPPMPFAKNWEHLMFKRALIYAIDGGYDYIAWTKGDDQADRYGQRKLLNRMRVTKPAPGSSAGHMLEIYSETEQQRQGGNLKFWFDPKMSKIAKMNYWDERAPKDAKWLDPREHLSEGDAVRLEELAGAIRKATKQTGPWGNIPWSDTQANWDSGGVDQQVIILAEPFYNGGEGMRKFYDEKLVNIANDIGKKFGAKTYKFTQITDKVEHGKIGDVDSLIRELGRDSGIVGHAMPITPAMKDEIPHSGMSMFTFRKRPQVKRFGVKWTKAVDEIVSQFETLVGEHADLHIIDSFKTYAEQLRAVGQHEKARGDIGAAYNPIGRIVTLAMDYIETWSAMHHEAIHALRTVGAFTDPEWRMLERYAKVVWMGKHNIRAKYEDQYRRQLTNTDQEIEQLLIEEAIAAEFEEYIRHNRKPDNHWLARIMERTIKILNMIRKAMNKQGFDTAADIFERVRKGEVGARPEGTGEARPFTVEQVQYSLGRDLTSTPNFKKWFGDSKTVDATGKPLILYHGTPDARGILEEGFRTPQENYAGPIEGPGKGPYWFTDDVDTALSYADPKRAWDYQGAEPEVFPVYVKMENPLVVHADGAKFGDISKENVLKALPSDKRKAGRIALDEDKAMFGSGIRSDAIASMADKLGYDGLVIRNVKDHHDAKGPSSNVYVSFRRPNIKSVKNNGEFSSIANSPLAAVNQTPSRKKYHTKPYDSFTEAWADETLSLMEKAGEGIQSSDKFRRLRRAYQDSFQEMARNERAAARFTKVPELGEDISVHRHERLHIGKAGWETEKLQFEVVEPLMKKVREAGVTLETVDDFLSARHAEERNATIAQNLKDEKLKGLEKEKRQIKANKNLDPQKKAMLLADVLKRIAAVDQMQHQFIEALTDPSVKGGSGWSLNEANEVMDKARQDGKYDQLIEISEDVYKMNRQTLQRMVRAGLISRKDYLMLTQRWKYYVPQRGWEMDGTQDEIPHISSGIGQGMSTRGPEWRRALGRRSKSDSPLTYSIMQAQSAIIRAERNKVGQAFLKFAMKHPQPEIYTIEGKTSPVYYVDPITGQMLQLPDEPQQQDGRAYKFGVKVDGRQHIINLHDPRMAVAFKELRTADLGLFLHYSARMNRFLSTMYTAASPGFVAVNFVRDAWSGTINLGKYQKDVPKIRRKVWLGLPKAIGASFYAQYNPNSRLPMVGWYRDFAQSGGKTGWIEPLGLDYLRKKQIAMVKTMSATPSDPKTYGTLMKRYLMQVRDLIFAINTGVENGIRLSTYKTMREAGISEAKAAEAARMLTVDFNKKGTHTRGLSALYLFINPAIQGNYGAIYHGKSKKVLQGIGTLVAFAAFMDSLNRFMSDEDDDERLFYDKIPSYVKEGNLVIMIPGGMEKKLGPEFISYVDEANKRGAYFKLPMPWVYNAFAFTGQNVSSVVWGAMDPTEAALRSTLSYFNSMNPFGGADSFAKAIMPTATAPIMDLISNTNRWGNPIMPERATFEKYDLPASERYFKTVNPFAKSITTQLNSLTGGDRFHPGVIDVSPETLEYLAEFVFGGAGKFVNNSISATIKTAQGEPIEPHKMPIIRRLYAEHSQYVDRDLYYKMRAEVQRTHDAMKAYKENKDEKSVKWLNQKRKAELGMYGKVRGADAALRKLTKARRYYEALGSEAMKPAEKKKQLESIDLEMAKVMTDARREYYRRLRATGRLRDEWVRQLKK